MENINIICTICGCSKHNFLFSKDQWQVHMCKNCGLGVLEPRPSRDQIERMYGHDYFQVHYSNKLSLYSPEMVRRLQQENHRIRFFSKFKNDGKILDIGCGRGYFLLACRKHGYNVEGIDISAAAATHISEEFKIRVHIGKLENIKLKELAFDVITLWHSLEHTSDPNLYIQMAAKWLKDDGILVIDVPNYEGYDARMYWNNWPHWDLPFHFYHFNPGSLSALLRKHGFIIVRRKSYLSDYVKEKLERKSVPRFLARIIAQCYTGGSYAVVARKIKYNV